MPASHLQIGFLMKRATNDTDRELLHDHLTSAGNRSRRGMLTSGPIEAALLSLTAPMLVGVFSMVAFNLTDTYFVSLLGTGALAAITFTFPVILVLNAVSHGIAIGAAAIISQVVGAGDSRRMQQLTTDASLLGLFAAIPLTAVGLVTIRPLFIALGASLDLLPMIGRYMTIWYSGLVFVIVPAVGMNAIRALGDTVTPAIIMIIAFAVNVVLDPILIFGIGGLPHMGIAGAAAATVFSRGLTALAAFWVMWRKKRMLAPVVPNARLLLRSWYEVLHVGVPATLTLLMTPLCQAAFIRIVTRFGPEAIAAIGAGMRLESFALILVMALSSAIIPFVGQNWGAGKRERVVIGLRRSFQFSMVWGVLSLAVIASLATYLARLFSEDPSVIAHLRLFLLVVPLGYGLQGMVLLAGSAFNAIRKPRWSLALSTVHLFVLFLPFAYIGSVIAEFTGLLAGVALANASAGVVALIWTRRVIPDRAEMPS
jgi:putative MATE family efflux protein